MAGLPEAGASLNLRSDEAAHAEQRSVVGIHSRHSERQRRMKSPDSTFYRFLCVLGSLVLGTALFAGMVLAKAKTVPRIEVPMVKQAKG